MQTNISNAIHELKLGEQIYTDSDLEQEIESHVNKHTNIRVQTFLSNHRDICGEFPVAINCYDFGEFTVVFLKEFTGRKAVVISSNEISAYHLNCSFLYFLNEIRLSRL